MIHFAYREINCFWVVSKPRPPRVLQKIEKLSCHPVEPIMGSIRSPEKVMQQAFKLGM
jgi:hypothetical protein